MNYRIVLADNIEQTQSGQVKCQQLPAICPASLPGPQLVGTPLETEIAPVATPLGGSTPGGARFSRCWEW